MQADLRGNLKQAIHYLEVLPETPRVMKALMLLKEELDEVEGPSQEEILAATKGQVEEIRPARGHGTYLLQKIKCGDPSCHCMKPEGALHGPYWYLFTTKGGKTKSKYIGKKLSPEVQIS